MSANSFTPQGNTTEIDVTATASTGVQALSLPLGTAGAMVYNAGPNDCWLAFGTSAVAAVIPTNGSPANGQLIPAGIPLAMLFPPSTYFSAITKTGETAKLYITRGEVR